MEKMKNRELHFPPLSLKERWHANSNTKVERLNAQLVLQHKDGWMVKVSGIM